jgi:hypothetical protein
MLLSISGELRRPSRSFVEGDRRFAKRSFAVLQFCSDVNADGCDATAMRTRLFHIGSATAPASMTPAQSPAI